MKFIAALDMAIALITLSGPTACAINGVRAGMPSAIAVPPPSPRMKSHSNVIVSVTSMSALISANSPVTTCEMSERFRFSKRSASEPPTRENRSMGRPNESEIAPTAPKDSVRRQASSARATCCICMPVKEKREEVQRKR